MDTTNGLLPNSGLSELPQPQGSGSPQSQQEESSAGVQQPSNNEGEESFVKAKQAKHKEIIIEQLKKIPIVTNALEKTQVCNKSTYYRWINEDKDFRQQAESAISEGKLFINDLSENQLIGLIRDGSFPAIQLWLRTHHVDYRNRLEITGKIKTTEDEDLNQEQENSLNKALNYAESIMANADNNGDPSSASISDASPSDTENQLSPPNPENIPLSANSERLSTSLIPPSDKY